MSPLVDIARDATVQPATTAWCKPMWDRIAWIAYDVLDQAVKNVRDTGMQLNLFWQQRFSLRSTLWCICGLSLGVT
jgi:hypothetical protein